MHPGWADTPGVENSLPRFYRVMKPWLRDQRMGADTVVWLATASCLKNVSGKFWLDRKVQPIDLSVSTRASREQRNQLISYLEQELSKV